jgi:hypothetical protein
LLSKNIKIKVYRTVILPVVLYRHESWSLALRVFGPERDEVTGEWRKLHNEELKDLHPSPDIIWMIKSRRMRWMGHIADMGEGRGACRVVVEKPE